MKRKWAKVTTADELYCSSSFDYFLDVWLWVNADSDGPRQRRYYHLNSHSFVGSSGTPLYKSTPKYVKEMIREQLHAKFTAGSLTIVEGTRDGGHRTTNHRYHDPEQLMIYLKPKEGNS